LVLAHGLAERLLIWLLRPLVPLLIVLLRRRGRHAHLSGPERLMLHLLLLLRIRALVRFRSFWEILLVRHRRLT
jgi:hypothetical protein